MWARQLPAVRWICAAANELNQGPLVQSVPRSLAYLKPFKRLRQFAQLVRHLPGHVRCNRIIRRSGIPFQSLKYVGDYLSLSLNTSERRQALVRHYEFVDRHFLGAVGAKKLGSTLLWQKRPADGSAELRVYLEASTLAPMEGELQLRFAHESDLFWVTFSFVPGALFGVDAQNIVLVGGIQGQFASRAEIRKAAKANSEISPAATLILLIQTIARVSGVSAIVVLGEHDQIGSKYARRELDYHRFLEQVQGVECGGHYRIPLENQHRPLSEINRTHRQRTRRKREEKSIIQAAAEEALIGLLSPNVAVSAASISQQAPSYASHQRVSPIDGARRLSPRFDGERELESAL